MNRILTLSALSILVSWAVVAPTQARGEAAALQQVPEDAKIVAHVRGVNELREKVTRTIRRIIPGGGGYAMATQFEFAIDGLLGGREISGVPQNGHVFLVLNEFPQLPPRSLPQIGLVVEVNDYKRFRNSLLKPLELSRMRVDGDMDVVTVANQSVFFLEKEGYAVVALSADLAKELAATSGGFGSRFGVEQAKRFVDSDVSLYLNMAALFDAYGELVFELRRNMKLFMISQAAERGATDEMIELIDQVVAVLVQGIRDGDSLMITASLEEEGFAAHADLAFHPNTKTARLLKGSTRVSLDELADLPIGYAGVGTSKPFSNSELNTLADKIMSQIARSQAGQFGENLRLVEEAGEEQSFSLQCDANTMHGINVSICQNPAKLLEAELLATQFVDAAGFGEYLKGSPQIRRNAVEHRGYQLHSIEFEYDTQRLARLSNIDVDAARRQLGGDVQRIWIGAKDKTYVQVTAEDQSHALEILDSWIDRRTSLKLVPGFVRLREHLPRQATMFQLFEANVSAQSMFDQFTQSMGGRHRALPAPLPGREEYAGFSVTVDEPRVSCDLWITLEAWRRYFDAVAQSVR